MLQSRGRICTFKHEALVSLEGKKKSSGQKCPSQPFFLLLRYGKNTGITLSVQLFLSPARSGSSKGKVNSHVETKIKKLPSSSISSLRSLYSHFHKNLTS